MVPACLCMTSTQSAGKLTGTIDHQSLSSYHQVSKMPEYIKERNLAVNWPVQRMCVTVIYRLPNFNVPPYTEMCTEKGVELEKFTHKYSNASVTFSL